MDLHDMIVKELVERKSLAALIYMVEHGRELELTFDGKAYFISCDGSQKYVSMWDAQNEQSFDTVDELIENAVFGGTTFLAAWERTEIQTLF